MASRKYFAHSRRDNPDRSAWHPLQDHLESTASRAGRFAQPWRASDWAYLAGRWHDIGKYSQDFQALIAAAGGEDAHVESRVRVDHSTAGAQHAVSALPDRGFGKALAYAIAGHHGGIPDGISEDSCLRSRLEKQIPDYSMCPNGILASRSLQIPFALDPNRPGMQLSMFIRMLYSCLVDADFLDTESFFDPERKERRTGYRSLPELAEVFFENLDNLRSRADLTPVNELREAVLHQCLSASKQPPGFFSLTVPTGGGKTLSSMAFALRHAIVHDFKRVIYVIPFTSIIEQNAAVFRSMVGDQNVLEHHSNFEPQYEDHRSRLAAENWDAPIVVTTNVQFFESLFANRSSRCRKLHNIAESVVILDEVQTLPSDYLLPCLEALQELAATYRTSIVLCSATQPAVQKRPQFPKGIEDVREIVGDPQRLSAQLKRTQINVLGKISNDDLAERLLGHQQTLCVVSTRKLARALFLAMSDSNDSHHLSALMCPAHRREVLTAIRARLASNEACRVISTQLIEAGVDIDFPVVYRSLAGIDSIAQAAGRCNREGRLPTGHVYVFEPESGIPAGYFRQSAQAAESVIRRYPEDILSLDAIHEYFKLYYWTKGDALDKKRILERLHAGCQDGDFPFKSIADDFKLIESPAQPIVIPYNSEARRLIALMDQVEFLISLIRPLQQYSVSVYPNQFNQLLSSGYIELRANLFPVLTNEKLYSSQLGLTMPTHDFSDPRDLIT